MSVAEQTVPAGYRSNYQTEHGSGNSLAERRLGAERPYYPRIEGYSEIPRSWRNKERCNLSKTMHPRIHPSQLPV